MRKSLRICGLIISFSLMLAMGMAQFSYKLTPQDSQAFASEDAYFYLTLKNTGTRSVSNIIVSLGMGSELGGERNITINSLSAGATYTRSVQIITTDSTPLKNYTINSTVYYGGEIIEYPQAELEVIGFPLTIIQYFRNQDMKAGDDNALLVEVKNVGDGAISALSIDIDYPGGFISNMSRNLYIPEVAQNLQLRQEFEFIAPADADGDYHIGVNAVFKDSGGKSHTITRYAKVHVAGSPAFSWLETLLTIMIVILVGLILLGRAK